MDGKLLKCTLRNASNPTGVQSQAPTDVSDEDLAFYHLKRIVPSEDKET